MRGGTERVLPFLRAGVEIVESTCFGLGKLSGRLMGCESVFV